MAKGSQNINIQNRKARFNFQLLEKIVAGIMLSGTEIKSIRAGNADLADAYCSIEDNELFVHNLYIAEYKEGTYNNHDTRRKRKLLITKQELKKWMRKTTEKGNTIVPTRLFVNERNLAKLEIALATGKREFDKRQTIKKREEDRDLKRMKKQQNYD